MKLVWNLASLLLKTLLKLLVVIIKGRHLGTFGEIGVLSFNGNKIITTGGGGALLFNDPDLSAYAKHLTTTAKGAASMEFLS